MFGSRKWESVQLSVPGPFEAEAREAIGEALGVRAFRVASVDRIMLSAGQRRGYISQTPDY